jgi:hypothetical protein
LRSTEINPVPQEGWQVREVPDEAHPLATFWAGLNGADFLVELKAAPPVDPAQDVHHRDFMAVNFDFDSQRGVHLIENNQRPRRHGRHAPTVVILPGPGDY